MSLKYICDWSYIPILAISPAEMVAIEQLPDKAKDQLLPLFPLKGWTSALKLESTLERIKKAIGNRSWIADVDERFLSENKTFLFTGEYPEREVFVQLESLLDPEGGYSNWCDFIESNSNVIPCLRHENLQNLDQQIKRLSALNRGLVLRILVKEKKSIARYESILSSLRRAEVNNLLIIYDLEDIDSNFSEEIPLLEKLMAEAKKTLGKVYFSISSSSFPMSFAGRLSGEFSIYERFLFNRIDAKKIFTPLIYSDRGSARAVKQEGGAGVPPPRIDYPLKKDWKFVRREFDSYGPNSKERRKAVYCDLAREIISSDYWVPELRLWGTQQIEITAERDEYSIDSAQKSTAVRINIHLFNQIHYNEEVMEINTDEEWVD